MGKVKKFAILFFLSIAVLSGGYILLLVISSYSQGYSWREMDWDRKGYTSIGDFFVAGDIGKREFVRGGMKCTDYFSYKDGLSVKVVCLE